MCLRPRNSDSARRELLGNGPIRLWDFMGPSYGHLKLLQSDKTLIIESFWKSLIRLLEDFSKTIITCLFYV